MGMSINKIIKRLLWLENYNEEDYCGGDRIQDEHGDWYYKVTEEDFEAFRQAADIMRKYQKIQEIHKKWFCDYTSAEAYTKISEVLNGNDAI